MEFILAIAENQAPSTKAPNPYMHIFLDAGEGNILAFVEIPDLKRQIYLGDEAFMSSMQRKIGKEKDDLNIPQKQKRSVDRLWPR